MIRRRILITLEILVVLLIVWQLWAKPFPLWVYLAAITSLGLIIATPICFYSQRRAIVIAQIVVFLFLLTNTYLISNHYAFIAAGDAYWDYGVLRTFVANEDVSFTPWGSSYLASVSGRSGFPMIHILAYTLSRVCDIPPFYLNFIVPEILFIGVLAFIYILLRRIQEDLHLNKRVLIFAILALAAPTQWLVPMMERQTLATFLFAGILYTTYRQISRRSLEDTILLLILVLTLVFTHEYTSTIAVIYLFLFSIFVFIYRYVSEKRRTQVLSESGLPGSYFAIGIIMVAFLFMWWNAYASFVWPYVGGVVNRIMEVLKTGIFRIETFEFAYAIPPAPSWAVTTLWLRNAALVIPGIIGFILLFRTKNGTPQRIFFIYSIIAAGIIFILDVLITWAAPYRMIDLFLPLILLCIGIFYDRLFIIKRKYISVTLTLILVTLLVSSSLMGLAMNRFIPHHLYDPSVSWLDMGEHPKDWERLENFFSNMVYEDVDKIVSEDVYALSLLLPVEEFGKIEPMGTTGANVTDDTMVIAFRGLSPRSYILSMPLNRDPEFDEGEFKQEVTDSCNLIYNDGGFKIWN